MPICKCSQCYPSQKRAIKTIRDHLRNDQKLLVNQTNPELIAHLDQCIAHNTRFLQSEDGPGEGK
jgi:hypothetical protein